MILAGGTLVDPRREIVREGDLAISDGRICEGPGDGDRIDVGGCLVMPGNVCAHHHLYSALARGMPPPRRSPTNFLEILELIWWRLDRALDPETIELSAEWGSVVAAKAGTTCIVDHHASPNAIDSSLDAVAAGLEATGMRGVVCYEVTDRHGEAHGKDGVEENIRFHKWNRRPLVRSMIGAHASFTIGPSTLESLVGAARDTRLPIHIHLAEDAADERDSIERYGVRVAERLSEAGALQDGDLVAHGVHLDEREIDIVDSSAAWIAHNPRSNMNNGVGRAPVEKMGPRVVLGTDGIDGDLFAEAKACHFGAAHAHAGLSPDRVVGWMTAGSTFAGSLWKDPLLGTLEPGAAADVVVLEYQAPTPFNSTNLAGHLIFGVDATSVRDVIVGGRFVVRDRRHTLVDEEGLAARCRVAASKLWTKMQDL